MPRYTDADYLLGTFQAVCSAISCEECRAKYKDGTCKLEHWLKIQPTADVVKERQGHWDMVQRDRWIYAQCSECGNMSNIRTPYCPYCGAVMREEKTDAEDIH